MRFYDTRTHKIQTFTPREAGSVGMYSCGPTVYRSPHIGNLRTYITADLLSRAFEYAGLTVTKVTNITDVGHMTDEVHDSGEDKMLLGAEDEGLSPAEIAAKYTESFLRQCDMLNILRSSLYPKATDHIEEMIELISRLIEGGHAYPSGGNVYFDVGSFPGYGSLSGNTLEALQTGHRIEQEDPAKRRPADFLLWRASGPGRLMKWPSPWGEGYPGWHIECSAMSLKYLGEKFDVHTGGSDNIFPHHENEIAQSEAATGGQVVGYWLHSHHLLTDSRKMAKSAGNFITVDDLPGRGIDPLAFRFLMLQSRYRSQTNFTLEALDAAAAGLERLRRQVASLAGGPAQDLSEAGAGLDDAFTSAIENDLDTPAALGCVADVAGARISDGEKLSLLLQWDRVLGLDLDARVIQVHELPAGAPELIAAREKARDAGDFARADELREELRVLGVDVIDTRSGTRWTVR